MKGLCKATLAILVIAACGRDGGITQPDYPPALPPASGINALGTDPATGASIETNKDDYIPGEIVHVAGRGWAAGETVNLHMTENPDTHADVDTSVVADASGGFSLHYYDVQLHDLGVTFTLTATGRTSGSVAVATFTDGNIKFTTSPVNVLASVTFDQFNSSSTCGGSPTSTGNTLSYNSGHGLNTGRSMRVFVPAVPGYTYNGYSNPSGLTITPASSASATTLCISGTAPSTFQEFILNFTASPTNAAPTVDAGAPYSVVEGTGKKLTPTVSDPDAGDVLSYKWTVAATGIDPSGVCTFDDFTLKEPTITCTDDSNGGTFTLTLEVKDGAGGHTVTDNADLTVSNANPTASISASPSGFEGAGITLSGSGDDPGNNDDAGLSYLWTINSNGIDASGSCTITNATAPSASVECTDDSNLGTFSVSLKVSDDDGGSHTATTSLTVNNADPVANANGDYTGTEGGSVDLTGAKSDAGSNDSHTYKWTYTLGAGVDAGTTCTFSDDTSLSPKVSCNDDGTFTLTLKVTDDDGGYDTDDATLTLGNALPSVSINTPIDYAIISLLNGAITVNATYSDAGSHDTHDCEVFLDGAIDVLNDYSPVSNGSCIKTILPVEAGLYDLTVRIKDDDGGIGSATINIVVYDPSAGFVTGGGWINSPATAYKAGPSLAGRANFGFVSKYKRGATVPEGNTEFQFHAGNLNFHSSTYDFLVVNQAGTNAQFHGKGTINGTGSYTFMLWATDGGNSNDKFRIQITNDNDGDAVVYDNGVDQLIAGGSIVIHTGGKK